MNDGVEMLRKMVIKLYYAGYLVSCYSSFDAGQYGERIMKI